MTPPKGTTLAGARLVHSRLRSTYNRAFTLVELLIVVAIIAVVAVIAIPTMGAAQVDRRVFTDAGYVGELFRIARTRAVGRGAAILVKLTATNSGGGGTFSMYEAVTANPNGAGTAEVPSSACKSPTRWPGAGGNLGSDYQFVDAVNLSGPYEIQNSIAAQVKDPSGTVLASGTDSFLCFTPGGRIYYVATTATFDNVTPLGGAIQIDVRRFNGSFATPVGLTRTVWVTSSGSTRIVSQ